MKECSTTNEIVIFGAGLRGRALYNNLRFIPWKCYIDSNRVNDGSTEIPIVSYEEFVRFYHGEYVVISSRIYQNEMKKQLMQSGIREKIIDYGSLINSIIEDQYFDLEYLKVDNDKEIFLDVGCYDGNSSINFKKWCGEHEYFIYAFEPDSRCIETCILNLNNQKINYKLIPKGVWSDEMQISFFYSDYGDSCICRECGSVGIPVISLDKELQDERVTFIKMDIEGAELQALIGAKKIIRKNKPKLAISVYHKKEDIFEIPQVILEYYSGYTLYLRHYSIDSNETVLYAIPK